MDVTEVEVEVEEELEDDDEVEVDEGVLGRMEEDEDVLSVGGLLVLVEGEGVLVGEGFPAGYQGSVVEDAGHSMRH